jgi:hypothetical protein
MDPLDLRGFSWPLVKLLDALNVILKERTMKKALSQLIVWVFAPVLNSRRDALSLGRVLLFLYTLALVWSLVLNLPRLVAVQANPVVVTALVFLLVVVFLVLAVYCFGDKPWVRETVLLLANRASLNVPGDFAGVTRFEQKPVGDTLPQGGTAVQMPATQPETSESEPGI